MVVHMETWTVETDYRTEVQNLRKCKRTNMLFLRDSRDRRLGDGVHPERV